MTPLEWMKLLWSPVGPADTTVCAVLTVLALHMDRETGECWPGVARVARHAKVSERTVQRCVRAAALDGWLRVVPPRDHRDTNHYFPAQPSGMPLFEGVTPTSPGDTHVTGSRHERHPPGVVHVTPPVTPVSPKQVKEQIREQEGAAAFSCPACSGPMKRITPKRGGGPAFLGCVAYDNGRGCPGKRELDGRDSTPGQGRPKVPEAPNMKGLAEKVFAGLEAIQEQRAKDAAKGPSLLDSFDVSRLRRAARA